MRNLILSAILSLSSLAFASTWDIDTTHASASFSVKHLMVSNVTGRLGEVRGAVELDDKDVTKSKVEATIDVTGLNTNMPKRDEHLRSADFFDVAKFPTVAFKSTKIEKVGEKLKITGDLTMHGVTKPVTLEGEVSAEVKHPMSNAMVRAAALTTTVNREDFGLAWNKPMANNGFVVGKDVKISIDVELVKKEAAPAKK
jgi:polyisoprenoid-binding protein YceI